MKKLLIIGICIFVGVVIFSKVQELVNEKELISTGTSSSAIPNFDHIVLIVMENKSFEEIIGNKKAPYINSLIEQYSLAGNYSSITHPSLPNYIALLGGTTSGITTNCINCFIANTNLIDQFENSHKSWKAYFESLPYPCFLYSSYPYTQKYNPFVIFSDIFKNSKRCNNIVPYSRLEGDFKKISTSPNFVWISPNLCNDMHYCAVEKGDQWLGREVQKILNSEAFTKQNSLLILTWDEAERTGKNHVTTIFIGKSVKRNFISYVNYNHYSLIHTIEKAWSIPPITKEVKNSPIMSDLFEENK